MAGASPETTVAASQTPFLRESVNAVPGQVIVAAKVGNCHTHVATLVQQQPEADQYRQAILAGAIVGYPAVEE
jgi:hypothetical protein